jgi:predicted  nucleic acid-binding Zn-ribbon protein
MIRNGDGELWNDRDLADQETELERLRWEMKQSEQAIQKLRKKEDPEQGIFFAQEIFARQQEKLRIKVEIDLGRARKNRYLMAREWGEV